MRDCFSSHSDILLWSLELSIGYTQHHSTVAEHMIVCNALGLLDAPVPEQRSVLSCVTDPPLCGTLSGRDARCDE